MQMQTLVGCGNPRSLSKVIIERLCLNPGWGLLSGQPLLLRCLRPSLRVLRKIGGESIRFLQRTTRLGPQGSALQMTPREVVFRGAPIPPADTGVKVSTPPGCRLKSLALWVRIFTAMDLKPIPNGF